MPKKDVGNITVYMELIECGDDRLAICLTNSIDDACGIQLIATECDICGRKGELNPCTRCSEIKDR